jgi:regulator of sigma E protease
MLTAIAFIAVFAVIVFSHELGHFFTARKSGMRVWEFGFGFPPKLFGWYRDPQTKKIKFVGRKYDKKNCPVTLYSLNLLPVGGFVSIKGEDGEEVMDEDSFNAQKPWKKAVVIVSGVVMNFILAGVLLSIGLMVGMPATADGENDKYVIDRKLEVTQILKDKPADVADIRTGDVILQVGDLVNPEVTSMQEYTNKIGSNPLDVVVLRGTELIVKTVTPVKYENTGKYGIGVAIVDAGIVKYPWYLAGVEGFKLAGFYTKEIFIAFGGLIKGLFVGAVPEGISGPIGIAVMTGEVARLGLIRLLQFTAILSLNLAVLNILPIPALDGGRLLFLFLTKLNRKLKIDKYENMAHGIGFILLMILVIIVTVRDLGILGGLF